MIPRHPTPADLRAHELELLVRLVNRTVTASTRKTQGCAPSDPQANRVTLDEHQFGGL